MVIGRPFARIAAVLAWALTASVAAAQTPEDLFKEANAAYEQGRYEEAAEAYRSVLRYDVEDPIIEYNLGNAEFRRGNLGLAILHFERARRLDPVDEDIAGNLAFARSLRVDRVDEPPATTVVRWLRAAQNRLGPDRQAWVVLVWVWLTVGLMAWCFSRPGGWSAAYGWVLALLLIGLVLSASSWHVTLSRVEGDRTAVVLGGVVEVLAGPGRNNPTLFTVHEGLTMKIRSERDEWFQVSLPNGLNGWIAKDTVEEV